MSGQYVLYSRLKKLRGWCETHEPGSPGWAPVCPTAGSSRGRTCWRGGSPSSAIPSQISWSQISWSPFRQLISPSRWHYSLLIIGSRPALPHWFTKQAFFRLPVDYSSATSRTIEEGCVTGGTLTDPLSFLLKIRTIHSFFINIFKKFNSSLETVTFLSEYVSHLGLKICKHIRGDFYIFNSQMYF